MTLADSPAPVESRDLTAQRIRLADGRFLGYAEFGDPAGQPIFFFHGWIGSRLDFRPNDEAARVAGLRVVAVDRPGCGLSDFMAGRTLLDWPDDVRELADQLGIDRFALIGHSFGGPYVAACALKLAARVTRVGIVAGIAPLVRPGATTGMASLVRANLWLAGHASVLARPFVVVMGRVVRRPEVVAKSALANLPPKEIELLSRPEFAGFTEGYSEMYRAGSRGPYWDAVTFARPWGFRLEDVRPHVELWYGEADTNVPIQMGEYYDAALPDSRLTRYPGEGHFIFYSRAAEILATLVDGEPT